MNTIDTNELLTIDGGGPEAGICFVWPLGTAACAVAAGVMVAALWGAHKA